MAGQAITTRFVGPTNHRGARVKVYAQARPKGIAYPWDHDLDAQGNHDAAARAFIRELGWDGVWVEGGTSDGRGSAYTCIARGTTTEGKERCRRIMDALRTRTEPHFYGVFYVPAESPAEE